MRRIHPAQRPVTLSFDVFFDLRLNKRLSKQSWGWWFETLSCPLWRHRNGNLYRDIFYTSWPGTIFTAFPMYVNMCERNRGIRDVSIDGLVQDCCISIANAREILQSYTKPLIYAETNIQINAAQWRWEHHQLMMAYWHRNAFRITCPLWGESVTDGESVDEPWIISKRASRAWCFCVVCASKLLNKQLSYRWLRSPWHQYAFSGMRLGVE